MTIEDVLEDHEPRYTILARVSAEWPDSTNLTVKVSTRTEPSRERQADILSQVAEMYRLALDEEPARQVVVVLPWSESDLEDDHSPRYEDDDYE